MGNEFDDLPPVDVDVPDDPSALERDIEAYRREVRWQRRREYGQRLLKATHRCGTIVPLVVAIVCIGSMSIALLVMSARPSAQAPPHASQPGSPAAGDVGGPLPDVEVTVGDRPLRLRALESPAVLVMAPKGCRCAAALRDLVDRARAYSIAVYLVESGRTAPEQEPLARRLGDETRRPQAVEEPAGRLARTYGSPGATAVLVDGHGDVNMVGRNLSANTDWDEHLEPLRESSQQTPNGSGGASGSSGRG